MTAYLSTSLRRYLAHMQQCCTDARNDVVTKEEEEEELELEALTAEVRLPSKSPCAIISLARSSLRCSA